MNSLPPVRLGVVFIAAFVVALALRVPLERFFVLSVPAAVQPKRQFFLDALLAVIAGIVVMNHNMLVFGFPVGSGLKVVLGCIVAGFFLALDTSLARERAIIHDALARDMFLPPPRRLYSLTRKFSLVSVTTTLFVSTILGLVIAGDVAWLAKIGQSGISVSQAQGSVVSEVFFVMAVLLAWVVNLIISYSRNLKLLFDNETTVLERVSRGDLSQLVPVATRDEFGVIAGHTNNMIEGLRDRTRLIAALKLAEEVQQNFLPRNPPSLSGLDIAGTSKYCDETGGDYFDYLTLPNGRLGVVVADASDHGVGAALYMTTARAFLLSGARNYIGPARLLKDVNWFLSRDSVETSRFMSMFFLEIEPSEQTLRWVRAGHDPAILYDSNQDRFLELDGEGLALGVVEDFEFQEYVQRGWNSGSVIVVGTDGIRELQNTESEMFGQQRLHDVIRRNASEPAESIQNTVLAALHDFQGDAPQQDDITLVVIKLL
ncbi:MAG: SpoIIE family protein phosphatase [Deltaproteobacteria bacterium]|nr:MAG: SpoIIE family protein phosphatase [Deltaproteobacteria bacterium]